MKFELVKEYQNKKDCLFLAERLKEASKAVHL